MTPCNTPATPPNFPDALVAFSRMSTNDKVSTSPSGERETFEIASLVSVERFIDNVIFSGLFSSSPKQCSQQQLLQQQQQQLQNDTQTAQLIEAVDSQKNRNSDDVVFNNR